MDYQVCILKPTHSSVQRTEVAVSGGLELVGPPLFYSDKPRLLPLTIDADAFRIQPDIFSSPLAANGTNRPRLG